MSHYTIVVDRALERARAFGTGHHSGICPHCKGRGEIVALRRALWGLIRWIDEDTCPDCHGVGRVLLGDHLGESERLIQDIERLAHDLARAESVNQTLRFYGVRGEHLDAALRAAGCVPAIQGAPAPIVLPPKTPSR